MLAKGLSHHHFVLNSMDHTGCRLSFVLGAECRYKNHTRLSLQVSGIRLLEFHAGVR